MVSKKIDRRMVSKRINRRMVSKRINRRMVSKRINKHLHSLILENKRNLIKKVEVDNNWMIIL